MEPATVSVVVPTRDRTDLLAEALTSVRAVEGDDLRFEIIVADNSASRSAEAMARRFSAKYVVAPERGAAAARNAAMDAATSEFISFLDDDDLWLPSHIRPHLRMLAEQPELGAVVGPVINTDRTATQWGPAWPQRLPRNGDVRSEFFLFQPQIGATVVRAGVAREVGGFDNSLPADEDWDWHLRLAACCRVGFANEPMVLFRQRPVGADTRLMWSRLGWVTIVMWRNMLRMPGAVRPSTLRAFVAHRGTYSFNFRAAASAHVEAGDIGLAKRALAYSFVASPPHFVTSLALDRTALRTLRGAFTSAGRSA
jgi:glycosyltransferase involved in cell wall biosynthesis